MEIGEIDVRGIVFIACLLFSCGVQAQTVCTSYERILERFKLKFNEVPVAQGLHRNGVIEILSSDTGTWSMILTYPDGKSCLVSSGEFWEVIKPELIEEGA